MQRLAAGIPFAVNWAMPSHYGDPRQQLLEAQAEQDPLLEQFWRWSEAPPQDDRQTTNLRNFMDFDHWRRMLPLGRAWDLEFGAPEARRTVGQELGQFAQEFFEDTPIGQAMTRLGSFPVDPIIAGTQAAVQHGPSAVPGAVVRQMFQAAHPDTYRFRDWEEVPGLDPRAAGILNAVTGFVGLPAASHFARHSTRVPRRLMGDRITDDEFGRLASEGAAIANARRSSFIKNQMDSGFDLQTINENLQQLGLEPISDSEWVARTTARRIQRDPILEEHPRRGELIGKKIFLNNHGIETRVEADRLLARHPQVDVWSDITDVNLNDIASWLGF